MGRREPERSEDDRSAINGKTAAPIKPHPDPEVVAQAKRRRFTAEYKQRILTAVDQEQGSGGIGALLRREGLYSSLLASWRREREAGVLQALAPREEHRSEQCFGEPEVPSILRAVNQEEKFGGGSLLWDGSVVDDQTAGLRIPQQLRGCGSSAALAVPSIPSRIKAEELLAGATLPR